MVFDCYLYFIQNVVYSAILPCSTYFFIQPNHPQLNNIQHPSTADALHGWWERFLRTQTSRLRWFAEKTSLPVEVADRVKTRLLFSRSSTNERTNKRTNEGASRVATGTSWQTRPLSFSFIHIPTATAQALGAAKHKQRATHKHTVAPQIATEGKGRGGGRFRKDLRSGKPRTQSC
jgi:hypothetical protein